MIDLAAHIGSQCRRCLSSQSVVDIYLVLAQRLAIDLPTGTVPLRLTGESTDEGMFAGLVRGVMACVAKLLEMDLSLGHWAVICRPMSMNCARAADIDCASRDRRRRPRHLCHGGGVAATSSRGMTWYWRRRARPSWAYGRRMIVAAGEIMHLIVRVPIGSPAPLHGVRSALRRCAARRMCLTLRVRQRKWLRGARISTCVRRLAGLWSQAEPPRDLSSRFDRDEVESCFVSPIAQLIGACPARSQQGSILRPASGRRSFAPSGGPA